MSTGGVGELRKVGRRPTATTRRSPALHGAARAAGRVAYVALGLVLSCNWPTSPSEVPHWVLPHWACAQENLIRMGEPRALGVPPDWFRFVPHEPEGAEGGFRMEDGRSVYGYFDPIQAEVHYSRAWPSVVEHEAGHAILFALSHGKWRCVGHPDCPHPWHAFTSCAKGDGGRP